MRNKIHGFNLDMLRACYEVCNIELMEYLKTLEVGEKYLFYSFYLLRTEGKHYDYVFQIWYDELGEDRLFGELRFGLNRSSEDANLHVNGKPKAWISVDNRVLYSEELYYLHCFTDEMGLVFHNITKLDLCLDMTMDIAKYLKRLIRCKEFDVILNGKRVKNRKDDRPEILYTYSGDLDRHKYLTLNIKQKKAIKDKSQGLVLTAYNKLAEITNSSSKEYILELFGNPKKIHRLEVHFNNEEIKEYFSKSDDEYDIAIIHIERILFKMFYDTLKRLIRFEHNGKIIEWWDILDGVVTTPRPKRTNSEKKDSKRAS